MMRPWVLELTDGSKLGPWITSKKGARLAALRVTGRGTLPRGSKIREWSKPTRSLPKNTETTTVVGNARSLRPCEECGNSGALLVGRVGGRGLRTLCERCDR